MDKSSKFNRIQLIRVLLIVAGCLLIARLFYVQIIKHEFYQAKALAEHIKKFEISAPRGIIKFQDGQNTVPIALNEKKYTIYADPAYIEEPEQTANKLIGIIGGNKLDLVNKLSTKSSRYVVLAKKFTKDQADRIDGLELKGIGKKEVNVRTYPQGNMAAHVLGFVNDDGEGQYGIEQYLNNQLSGQPGMEKAVTDIRGIPLAVNNDNILKQAKAGQDVVLTIDIGMQKIVEDAIKSNLERTKAIRATGIIMEVNTGNIKAMATYPNFDPGKYDKVSDSKLFINPAVSLPWEPGSIMKPLIVSAAFTEKAATPETSFYDPGYVTIGDRTITDSTAWGAQTMSFRDIINKSLNTGAVFVLKTLGGGSINNKARNTWFDYLTKHYFFAKNTGVQQSGETPGYVPDPNEGDGLEVRYANMSFGQGLTVTPLQMVAAYNAIVNGGTYYQPNLVAKTIDNGKETAVKPKIVANNVISADASQNIREMIKSALEINNKAAVRAGYNLGGKSGTAQIAENGVYRTDLYNGAYVGYLGGDSPQYIILVRIDGPQTPGFASAQAYQTWDVISNNLIDNFAIKPKS